MKRISKCSLDCRGQALRGLAMTAKSHLLIPQKVICLRGDDRKNKRPYSSSKKNHGFTLIEMLLVLVIIASIIYMLAGYVSQRSDELRRDRVTLQMQQILNAAMSYYVNNSYWPVRIGSQAIGVCTGSLTPEPQGSLTVLVSGGYLTGSTKNPWGNDFTIGCDSTTGNFTVASDVLKNADATIIAGRLPGGRLLDLTSGTVLSTITIPGQNLNNARSINYAGIYHSGACVPAPKCPNNMQPSISVVPTGVTGIMYKPICTGTYPNLVCTGVADPITSFTAFARGAAGTNAPTNPANPGPQDCATESAPTPMPCNYPDVLTPYPVLNDPAGTTYWRVCLKVVTNLGTAYPSLNTPPSPGVKEAYEQGKMLGSVLALTRCVPLNERPTGSDFTVWTPNSNWNK